MPRYAVLHDLTTDATRPVGLAMEMDGYVLVHVPREFGIPERHRGEYRVLQPDGTYVTYAPDDAGYFDQVLVDLSWAFGVGEQGKCEEANFRTLLHLLVAKVERERNRDRVGEYDLARAERSPGRRLDAYASGQVYCPEPGDQLAVAARGIVSA